MKIRSFLLVLLVLLILSGVIFSGWYFLALHTAVSSTVKKIPIEVTKGSSTWSVARQLQQAGIIHSPLAFVITAKLKRKTVKADVFEIDASQPLKKIVGQVTTTNPNEITITIPEGWRIEQIAQRLVEKKLIESVDSFIAIAEEYEGYLFPDTYQFNQQVTPEVVRDRLRENFQARTKDLYVSKEDLILASIIEREAKRDEDRPKMAGVFKNRLIKNMPLEADPTVQYAIDSSAFAKVPNNSKSSYQFWKPITLEQAKTFDHKYNTYRNVGLPPAPIANPGLKSIEAAVNLEKHDYFYFFNLSDGSTIYSKTLDEHNANKRKYGFGD